MSHPETADASVGANREPGARPQRIAFVGDVHGCVLHMLAALEQIRVRRKIELTAIVQVGDLQAYPSPARLDEAGRWFIAANPAQGDFFRLLHPTPELAATIEQLRTRLPAVHFVSGNHEDLDWLADLHRQARGADPHLDADGPAVVPVDPLGVFHHVACGRVTDLGGLRMAFLGRIDAPEFPDVDLDVAARDRLLEVEPGTVDVLVTHDGPAGMSVWRGQPQGSAEISRMIGHLRPSLHISGHYHHPNGPRRYGRTRSYALGQLVYSKPTGHGEGFELNLDRANPEQRVSAGSIGLLDPSTGAFEYVDDDWLAEIRGDRIDLVGWAADGPTYTR